MSETTAQRIAQSALDLLESEGPDAVSMRRVAEAVGITPMAIYHHFPNREALLNFIPDAEFAKFLGNSQAHFMNGPVEERILAGMNPYIDYAFDHPRVFDYVFAAPRPGARRYPEDFRARRSPTLTPAADALKQAMKAGELQKDDVWEVAFELWAVTHGYVALYRGGRINLTKKQFRALVRRALRRLIRGLEA
ncbi:MAG: TetR/AcrR family transcriptional regulator [Silvibacterium sp.]